MFFLRHLFSSAVALMLMIGPNSYSKGIEADVSLQFIHEKLQTYKTLNDAVADIGKTSPEIGRKLGAYLRSKELGTEKLPATKIVDGALEIGHKNKARIVILNDHRLQVSWDRHRKIFSHESTFEDITQEIEGMTSQKTSSTFNFFITNAYANGILVAIPVAIYLAVVVYLDLGRRSVGRAMMASRSLAPLCSNSFSSPIEELAEAYNVISEAIEEHCLSESHQVSVIRTCEDLRSTKGCLHEKITRANVTNNGNRDAGKPVVEFRQNESRYRIQRATRQ